MQMDGRGAADGSRDVAVKTHSAALVLEARDSKILLARFLNSVVYFFAKAF
jgi:hypothetical protein